MNLNRHDLVTQATDLLQKMQGQLTWSICHNEFGAMWMNFGEPHLSAHGPYRSNSSSNTAVKAALGRRVVKPIGDWQLFIESADWEAVGGSYQASRTSEMSERIRVLDQLDGQRLLSARLDQQKIRWVFNFDLGGILMIGSAQLDEAAIDNDRDESQWTLFFWNAGNATWTLDGRLVFES